jgi:anti-sigma B factor antagonist
LEINITHEDDVYCVKLKGMLDVASSPDLQKHVEAISSETYEKGGFNIVFDLADIEYVSSAGIRVLLMARKIADRQKGRIAVINVGKSLYNVIDMTGFAKILNEKARSE